MNIKITNSTTDVYDVEPLNKEVVKDVNGVYVVRDYDVTGIGCKMRESDALRTAKMFNDTYNKGA
jgi:hypothetical protein